jgi:hypothetical protein
MHETIKFYVAVRNRKDSVKNAKRFDKKWRLSLISRYFLGGLMRYGTAR